MNPLVAVYVAAVATTLVTLAAGLASNWWRTPRWMPEGSSWWRSSSWT